MTSLVVVIGAALLWSPASAQSLADVAKRGEEQRAKAAAEKTPAPKVITNGDLKPDTRPRVEVLPPSSAADTPAQPDQKKPDAKKAGAADDDLTKTEAFWRQRATELHTQLAADEKAAVPGRAEIARMQRNIDTIGCFICSARSRLESTLLQMQDQQKRLEEAVTSDRAAIREFEEEGRRRGIFPGWLRPR